MSVPAAIARKKPPLVTGCTTQGHTEPQATTTESSDGSIRQRQQQLSIRHTSQEVSFDSVRVVNHSVRLGDNPSVSVGLPVRLGSKRDSETFDVDEYEDQKKNTNGAKPMVISKERRDTIVKREHSRSSMIKARKEVRKIKMSRLKSRQQNPGEESTPSRKKVGILPRLFCWIRGCFR